MIKNSDDTKRLLAKEAIEKKFSNSREEYSKVVNSEYKEKFIGPLGIFRIKTRTP